tara:strand:- start:173 stop:1024 length:852 start_codon:yes stop_codon:yes gene_type:complete
MNHPATIEPSSATSVSKAVLRAHQANRRVRIVGQSNLEHLRPETDPSAILLSTSALNTIDLAPNDLIVHVGPGLDLQTLDTHLQAAGLYWPVSRLEAPGTIGGIVGSGRATASTTTDGPARRWVLGAQLVNGLGQILTVGGATVKNSVGYGLTHALWGSHGRLGVVTRLTLRLRTRTESDSVDPVITQTALLQAKAVLRCENLTPPDTNQVIDHVSMAKAWVKANDESRIVALYDHRNEAELAATELQTRNIAARVEPIMKTQPDQPALLALRASLDPHSLFA